MSRAIQALLKVHAPISALAFSLLLSACASTGATLRSGVGDTYLEHPPYYAGQRIEEVAGETGRIGHFPVAFQLGASQPAILDVSAARSSSMRALLEDMSAYLDSLGVSLNLASDRTSAAMTPVAGAIPPDVRFGCIPENLQPGADCQPRGDSALGRSRQEMQLAVGRPSKEWTAWTATLMKERGASLTLVVTLEVGQYLLRQEGWRGTKVLELGTNHRATLPWLTSLETPVSVLQLTASLVGADGKALRIGAEGFYARRSRLLVSAIDAQELLRDEDIAAVRTSVRNDLPGQPLAWQVAMQELVTRVTGRTARPLASNGAGAQAREQ